ncbi:RNA-binding S4 domain-containing protein [Granulosicoccaceae sp. 1_MG-2023]|nr:RNA-binding S4 domain-containing protein [Granulosicoccaceae sp. 1_MG-2023]
MSEEIIAIDREPVELYKLLKFEGLAESGAAAKHLVDEGRVTVNGEPESRRRRKLVDGDRLRLDGRCFVLRLR